MKNNRLEIFKVWFLWLSLWIYTSCGYSSAQVNQVSDFPGAHLAFETTKGDKAILNDVAWSYGTDLVLQGWDISASRFPLYLASMNKLGAVTPFIFGSNIIYGHKPALSPSGDYLAFWDSDKEQIHILYLRTTPHTVTLLQPEYKGGVTWSPDEQQLAHIDLVADKTVIIHLFDLGGKIQKEIEILNPVFLEYDYDGDISWSPDGRYIAFSLVKETTDYLPQGDVFVLSLNDTRITQLSNTPSWNDTSISWSFDSHRLAFSSTPVSDIPEVSGQLSLANVDGSCTKMVPNLVGVRSVSWSSVATNLAIVSTGGVYILDLNFLGKEYVSTMLSCP